MSKNKSRKVQKKPNVDNSRKAQRKQKRLEKKVHRKEHYLLKKKSPKETNYTPGRFVKRPASDDEADTGVKKKKPKLQPSVQDVLSRERDKEMREANKLKSQMDDRRKKILLKANQDEDKLIKKLEKQLGLNKSKNKNNFFSSDGLDYLLEICDRSTTEQIVAAEKHLAEVEGDSDFDEDLAAVTGKEIPKDDKISKKSRKIDDNSDDNTDDEVGSELSGADIDDDEELSDGEEDFSGDDESEEIGYFDHDSDVSEESEEQPTKSNKSKESTKKKNEQSTEKTKAKEEQIERIVKADEISKVFSDDEISYLSGDDEDDHEVCSGDEMNDEVDGASKKDEKSDIWEDIYGRKRDKEGNVIKEEKGVYVPPHLRNKDTNSEKDMIQLKRQIKSVLNKLAGTNLHWACTSIESLYNYNSRHSVNTALSGLWVEAAVGGALSPPRMLAELVACVAVLHANVGSELGAHFLQELVKMFDELTQKQQPLEDKRLENLVTCLALFYSFKIYESPLLYDMLNHLLASVSEKHIDCILAMLRSSGAVLRKQAPNELRIFVHDTQDKAAKLEGDSTAGSRMKFLLEVLMAIKNNNLMKIPNYDPTYQEHLKKMIKSIIRKGNYVTPLNIRLEDLLKADERGKWWVVGSAWEGQARPQATTVQTNTQFDSKLMELARKQRMNTDVRRTIFCVIMSAEDYMDAFEKLQHLGLKRQQEREVIHVLLACCLQEKQYNPYYALLGQKLCDTDRKYQLSIQFAIWDKIKDIESQPKQCLNNLAQFVTHLVTGKGLALSVLKVIQFSDLNKHSVRFMRQVLLSIIMNEDLQSALEVFHRISKPPKLHMFRESLKLFIQHFLVKNAGKKSNVLSDSEMVTLKERAAEVNKILTLYESKLQF